MLEALQFMSVRQRLEYNVIVFIYKMVNGMYSEEETGRVRRVGDITERATRQSENLNIEYKKTTAVQKSIMYDGIKMYNRVPNYMTNIKDLKQFKGEVRHWILNKNDI